MELKQRAYAYALDIIKLIDSVDKKELSARIIAKQLLRSGTSVGANITEAQGAPTRKDFANFFSYALKSANESVFWINLLKDTYKADNIQTENLLKETKEIANILGSSILTLRNKK